MKINITSVMVDDQAKARHFYTAVLGFELKHDLDLGEARWLTVTSPEGADGVELLLEPNWNPAVPARAWQKSLFDAGIPATSFGVEDAAAECARLKGLGVTIRAEPSTNDGVTTAMFDDTCGNLIMIVQTDN